MELIYFLVHLVNIAVDMRKAQAALIYVILYIYLCNFCAQLLHIKNLRLIVLGWCFLLYCLKSFDFSGFRICFPT